MESLECSILYAYSLLPISYSRLLDELCCRTATFIKSCLYSAIVQLFLLLRVMVFTTVVWVEMLSFVVLDYGVTDILSVARSHYVFTLRRLAHFLHSLELRCCFCLSCCLFEKMFSAVLIYRRMKLMSFLIMSALLNANKCTVAKGRSVCLFICLSRS